MSNKLVIFLPDVGEVPFELTEPTISVGRTNESDIFINDASVSVHHAEFVLTGGEYVLRDLGSTNGIRVNGKPTSEAKLCPGDRLRFGSVEGVFEPDVKGAEPQPLPPRKEAAASQPAQQSHRPSDFGNASPFTRKSVTTDPLKATALVVGVLVVLASIAVVVYVYMTVQAPVF